MTIGGTTNPVPDPFLVHGDAEPDRVGGDVPAARGAGRPLHAQGGRRLPGARWTSSPSSSARSSPEPELEPVLDARRAARAPGGDARRVRRPGRSCATRSALATATREPERLRPRRAGAVHRLRREPARLDQPRPRRPARSRSIRGRRYVLPPDVHELAKDVLRHRLVLTYQALAEERHAGRDPRRRARAPCPLPQIDLGRVADGERMTTATGTRAARRARCPAPLLRALDLDRPPARRGPARGRAPLVGARPRHRARAGPAVRAGRRRPHDRLERDRAHRRAARPRRGRRARAHDVARARHVAVDGLRNRRPAEGGRRHRRRARRRPAREPARQPRRHRHLRRPRGDARPPRQGRAGLLGVLAEAGREHGVAATSARPRSARRSRRDRAGSRARARSSSASPTSAGRATGAGRCSSSPAATTSSRSRCATAREQELPDVGDLWLVDPETGRQLRVDTSRRTIRDALRRGRCRRAGARSRPRCARPAPTTSCSTPTGDWLPAARALPAPRDGAAAMTSSGRLALLGLVLVPLGRARLLAASSAGAPGTPSASRTSTCSRASSSARRAGAGTCRPRSPCSRSRR